MKDKTTFSTIGIIGFGRFGKLLANFLKNGFKVVVYSKPRPKVFPGSPSLILGTLREVARCEIVILCVPISVFEEVVEKVTPFLKQDSLVVDTCSVKKHPIRIMVKTLPRDIEILGTHPLFGPDSIKNGLEGSSIVVFPVRIKRIRFNKIKRWLIEKELKVIEMSPDKHDRLIAKTQALTHLIGRILEEMVVSETAVDTPSFKKILESKKVVCKDSRQLFKDIQRFNPYAKKMRQKFKRALLKLEKQIG